jgi:hypothetical protein
LETGFLLGLQKNEDPPTLLCSFIERRAIALEQAEAFAKLHGFTTSMAIFVGQPHTMGLLNLKRSRSLVLHGPIS